MKRRTVVVVLPIMVLVVGLLALGCGSSSGGGDTCTADSCSGNGSCDDSSGSPVCTCNTGYAGADCSNCATGYHDDGSGNCVADQGSCTADSCSGHGSCDDSSGSPVCTCDTGYAGADCSNCATGYHDDGSGNCVADQGGCTADSCSGHGSCDDSSGSPVCTCDTGYAGADCSSCATGYHDDGSGNCVPDQGGPHPQGWVSPDQHGDAAKQGQSDCRTCHGADLGGQGDADSCDTCHAAGWRTNCTFCHGGGDNDTGAPPVDLAGNSSSDQVGAHTTHVTGANHMTYDCDQCHVKPTDVLSPGHMFDDTPGEAELDMSGGLSSAGSFDGTGCSTLYCHGNGRDDNGSMPSYTGTIDACDACHGTPPDTGRHRRNYHLPFTCHSCHANVASDSSTISGPELHVNGEVNVDLSAGGTYDYDTRSCDPVCHGSKTW